MVILAHLFLSCGTALFPPETIKGRTFPFSEATSIKKGMSPEAVLHLLGEPLERARQADGQVSWLYYAKIKQEDQVRLFGWIPVRRMAHEWDMKVEVFFAEEAVVKIQIEPDQNTP